MKLLEAVRKALFANELDNNLAAAYRLSLASGGTSGYSFGLCQLDVSNNPDAVTCLTECGFTSEDIARLKRKDSGVADLSARLKDHAEIIDRYDNAQIQECIEHVQRVAEAKRITFADDEAFVHVADYHNQFYMSPDGKMANFLAGLHRPVTADDIKTFKLGLPWGQKRPDDVKRRWNNIVKLMRT